MPGYNFTITKKKVTTRRRQRLQNPILGWKFSLILAHYGLSVSLSLFVSLTSSKYCLVQVLLASLHAFTFSVILFTPPIYRLQSETEMESTETVKKMKKRRYTWGAAVRKACATEKEAKWKFYFTAWVSSPRRSSATIFSFLFFRLVFWLFCFCQRFFTGTPAKIYSSINRAILREHSSENDITASEGGTGEGGGKDVRWNWKTLGLLQLIISWKRFGLVRWIVMRIYSSTAF